MIRKGRGLARALWICLLAAIPAWGQSGTFHYTFVDSYQQIQHRTVLGSTYGNWENLNALGGGPPTATALSATTGFGDSLGDHIFYAAASQHVYQLYYAFSSGSWSSGDLTALTGAALVATGSFLSSFADTPGEHLIYFGANQHVYQLYYAYSTHAWQNTDLTSLTGNTLAAVGSSVTSFVDSLGEHIGYLGTNEHV